MNFRPHYKDLSGIEYKKLTSGAYNKEEAKKIEQAKEWMKTRKFTHIYILMFDQQSIYSAVKKVYHTQGIDVLIVDYFKGSGDGDAFDSYKFNMNIELQMKLLKEFWRMPENKMRLWTGNNELQAEYYEFLKHNEFVKGDAPRPDKDAREKTSGLRDIGLYDEFTYLLPLCVDKETTEEIIERIIASRNNSMNYEDIILSVLMQMDNYKKALNLLKEEEITEELICNIGINRKSARYDKPYCNLYNILKGIIFSNEDMALELYEATKKIDK